MRKSKKPLMAQPITPKEAREAANKEQSAREKAIDRARARHEEEMQLAKEKYAKSVDDRRAGELSEKQFKSKQNAIRKNEVGASRNAATEIAAQRKMINKAYSNANDVDKGINRVKVKDVKSMPVVKKSVSKLKAAAPKKKK